MTATSASVRFGADGAATVESYLHLTGDTCITCCTYDDRAPILAVHDANVDISISVPWPDRVDADDLAVARKLAAVVARYVAELEKFAAKDRAATDDPAGQAA